MKQMKTKILLLLIFGGIAIVLALLSLVTELRFAAVFGIISTITSILLGIIAVLYTWLSGEKTLSLLNQIEVHNEKLVAKINQDLLRDAYDENGIEAARRNPFEKLHKGNKDPISNY
jgi:cell shape-determining protein MreC